MTKISEELVSRLEKLAKIELEPDEKQKIVGDLQSIVTMFDKLEEVDTEGVLPLQNMSKQINRFRDDEVGNELSQTDALSNVPDTHDGFIRVPKFLKPE